MRSRMICRVLVSSLGTLALTTAACNLFAQTAVPRAGKPSGDRSYGAVSFAPALSNLQPSNAVGGAVETTTDRQVSPSDQGITSPSSNQLLAGGDLNPQEQIANSPGQVELGSDATSVETLAPLQSRQLTLNVQAISISSEQIGTGLVPTASRPQWSSDDIASGAMQPEGLYTHVYWQASLIQHYPLYFEDAMLERHGHTRSCLGCELTQSAVSGAKFFGTIFVLPYLGTLQPKHQCVYALGHYRAGSSAPCLRSNLPYDKRAAIVESASVAGFFWAVPL